MSTTNTLMPDAYRTVDGSSLYMVSDAIIDVDGLTKHNDVF